MPTSIQHFLSRTAATLGLFGSMAMAPIQVWALPADSASVGQSGMPLMAANDVDGEVRDLVLKGDSIEVTYKNTGTRATAIVGELQVRGDDEELVSSVLLADSVVVKAGATVRMRVAMPTLPRGRYTMFAVVDFGGPEMTAAQAALEIR
jgi:hypothetical protein